MYNSSEKSQTMGLTMSKPALVQVQVQDRMRARSKRPDPTARASSHTNKPELRPRAVASDSIQELGEFLLTAYAVSPRSTGKSPSAPDYGITYSGTRAKVGQTVAVDPKVIPIGTRLYIEGLGWRHAEDVGGAVKGHHIDVLLPSDHDAILFGVRRHVKVYVEKSADKPRHVK
jgi:3D (Asp-Asp-Asp) domain-containing protein